VIRVVGIFALVVGCAFVLLGIVQVYVEAFRDKSVTKNFGADDADKVAALIAAIAKLPPFVLLVVTGIALIGVGQRLLDSREIFSY